MENYFYYQIAKFSEKDFNQKIIGNTFEFKLSSKQLESVGLTIIAKVINLELAENYLPFSFVVSNNEKAEQFEILINKIVEMKYVC